MEVTGIAFGEQAQEILSVAECLVEAFTDHRTIR